jgi:putative AlgH/UPF0301 family transcriptional regulator
MVELHSRLIAWTVRANILSAVVNSGAVPARGGMPIMSLRRRLLFVVLLTMAALAAPGGVNARGALRRAALVPVQFKNPKDLGVGKLLVASRGLDDPNFAGTVILLVHYDENGVVGLVLNRRTDVPMSKVLDLEAAKNRSDLVYLGGPVGVSAVVALFQSGVKINKAENVFDGVSLISDKLAFEQIISGQPDPSAFHVYVGYAGWTPEQLRAEVELGAWFVFPADAATVFNSDPGSLWMQMIEKTELKMAKSGPMA